MHSHMTKDLDNRLAAVEGHIAAIRRMLAEGRDCDELLLQLKAAESSVNKVSKIILQDHLNHCVRESLEQGDTGALDQFGKILDKYIR
jgi:DNA-binding FrmR family transcriptional regulator